MNTYRKTAIIVGVLFITATVTGPLSMVGTGSLRDPDYLINVSTNNIQVIIGILLELICVAAVVGIPVMMFSILKKHNEALALGYVGARIFEAAFFIVGSISYLSLLTLSQDYGAGAPGASHFQAVGTLLLAVHDWTLLLHLLPFGLAALMFYYLLYQSKLIPRFLSVWGLIGAPLVLAAGLLGMFGVVPQFSAWGAILAFPIASNEMVLAVWLIVKGFNPSAIASESA